MKCLKHMTEGFCFRCHPEAPVPRVNWKIRPRHELIRRVYELESHVRELQERLQGAQERAYDP